MAQQYDTIILGAGPGGMTAATYASRANMSVLMIDRGIYGGQMNNTAEIENYPGFPSILGPELAEKMYASSTQFGAEYAFGTVLHVEAQADGSWRVVTDMDEYSANTVIVATGAAYKKLDVPGEEAFAGRGVSYCAVCDGAFFRGQHVIVVGGGDSAVEEATYLAGLADHVTIVHRRDKLRAQQILQDRAFANEKISFVWNSEVEEILGDDKKVTGVRVRNNQTDETSEIDAAGVFIYVGLLPVSDPVQDLGITDANGWIMTNDRMETSQPGIFAVGDAAVAGQNAFSYNENFKMRASEVTE